MSRLPLNTLPAFRTVAELQNLRAAADVLHLTHSAVSQQIRSLEEQLGILLFERRGRRAGANRRRRPGCDSSGDRLAESDARHGAPVVRATLAAAANRPLARASSASCARDRRIGAGRRSAARGFPRSAPLR